MLSVDDPQGPLPVGQDATYSLRIKNRGTKTANEIEVVMHFSTGIEPTAVEGREHTINPGEVVFEKISQLNPGEEVVFNVTARATVAGTHEFRAADLRRGRGARSGRWHDQILWRRRV